MATILRTPAYHWPSQSGLSIKSFETRKHLKCLSFKQRRIKQFHTCLFHVPVSNKSVIAPKFLPSASSEEATETNQAEETQIQENSDDEVPDASSIGQIVDAEEKTASAIIESLQSYKEAFASNDEPKIAEIDVFLQSLEDEKKALASKVATLSEELSLERDRRLRIGSDFDNFRKRTERDRLSLVTNVQGGVVESLLPVLDKFERAKSQINVETEGEEKINNSYQSIFKQFLEILGSLSVVTVDMVGNPFDPMARYRVDSKHNRVLEQLFRVLRRVRSGFMKTWIPF